MTKSKNTLKLYLLSMIRIKIKGSSKNVTIVDSRDTYPLTVRRKNRDRRLKWPPRTLSVKNVTKRDIMLIFVHREQIKSRKYLQKHRTISGFK